jgi:hypothetical protein
MNSRSLFIKVSHQPVVLRDTPFTDVGNKPHMTEVNIFIHVGIEFRLLLRSGAVIIKSRVDLFKNK